MNAELQPKVTAAKAIVAAVGATATAVTTALATVSVVLADDKVDLAEVGSVATALVTLAATVYAVWRVPNRPKPAPFAGRVSRNQDI